MAHLYRDYIIRSDLVTRNIGIPGTIYFCCTKQLYSSIIQCGVKVWYCLFSAEREVNTSFLFYAEPSIKCTIVNGTSILTPQYYAQIPTKYQ